MRAMLQNLELNAGHFRFLAALELLFSLLLLASLCFVTAGCETRTISASGIGAREAHPELQESEPRTVFDKWLYPDDKSN